MLTWIREKFGGIVVGGIIAILAVVFIFYGVFTPKGTQGLGEGAVAGRVNGESISISEFNQAYNRQLGFYKNMLGGTKITEEQLRQFHIRESVFQELARRKMMIQEAQKRGYLPSDEEIRARVLEVTAFQKDGKFNLEQYKRVLEANGYTASSFEKLMRDDLSVEKWQDYFRTRVNVSEDEVKQEFLSTADKRNIKYVLLTNEAGKRDVHVDAAEIQKYLADPVKMNLIKSQYEAKKGAQFKGKSLESVKADLAHDIIASSRIDEIKKANQKLGEQVAQVMTAQKASDAVVNKLLRTYGVEVKSTGLVSRDAQYLPGVGEARELMTDAFALKSPINPADGGKVKVYLQNNWVLVAVVSEVQKPDLGKLATERDQLARQVIAKKERSLFETWLKEMTAKSKIDINSSVIQGTEAQSS